MPKLAAMVPKTMQAWQYNHPPARLEDSLVLVDGVEVPDRWRLKEDQVLVQVLATALNPGDYKLAEAPKGLLWALRPPAIPGRDYSGRVVATHASNRSVSEGQLVFGSLSWATRHGTLGQYVVAGRDEYVALPAGLSPQQAAGIGCAGVAAYHALRPDLVQAGFRVFINGGSGGVGTFAIQMAKDVLGASRVVVSCSSPNVQLCRDLGADAVIDYIATDLLSSLAGAGPVFDLAIDTVGMPTELREHAHKFLKPTGRFVQLTVDTGPGALLSLVRNDFLPALLGGARGALTASAHHPAEKMRDCERIARWILDGKVRVVVDRVFAWEQVIEAIGRLKTRRTVGKIIIHVAA